MYEVILSDALIQEIEKEITDFKNAITEACDSLLTIVDEFLDDDVVQTFFISGGFGAEELEKVQNIRKLIVEYNNTLSSNGNLIPKTEEYISNMKRINQQGK